MEMVTSSGMQECLRAQANSYTENINDVSVGCEFFSQTEAEREWQNINLAHPYSWMLLARAAQSRSVNICYQIDAAARSL